MAAERLRSRVDDAEVRRTTRACVLPIPGKS
jgi:hypothetical protein